MQLYLTGLGLLLWLLVWLPLSLLLWRVLRRRLAARAWGRPVGFALLSLLLFVVPFWDVAWAGWRLPRLCAQEAGVSFAGRFETPGFYARHLIYGRLAADYLKRGFRFVEGRDTLGQTMRYTLEDGEVKTTPVAAPASRYEYLQAVWSPLGGNLAQQEWLVVERDSGRVVARERVFFAFPGWLERPLVGAFGPVRWTCPGQSGLPRARYVDLVDLVLRPPRGPD